MKILFDHSTPFLLSHGGFQTQIEQTRAALQALGVEVEPLRWWDDTQKGDIIHYFGRPSAIYIDLARRKEIKVVVAELLSGLAARSAGLRALQRAMIRVARKVLPADLTAKLAWDAYRLADACVALTPWEAHLMATMFGAPPERVHCVPNGVEREFLESAPAGPRDRWLVCTATIVERKRVLELVQAAVRAQTPVWIVGRPYAETDGYAQRFTAFVRQHPHLIRYAGAVNNRAELASIYRQARGFVLLSARESLSLSALEAAGCGCPLLLSDQPWARAVFPDTASFCPVPASIARTAEALRSFYDAAPGLKPPPKPKSWLEVGAMLKELYEGLLRTSR
jgi:glycosyltransferase involved in cell wall biosynthesis